MGGRESAKLSRAAQKAGERCCQVELLVSILIEVMLRYISSARPSELQRLHVYYRMVPFGRNLTLELQLPRHN